jgi:zinc finger SWIM domain-containing protein 3
MEVGAVFHSFQEANEYVTNYCQKHFIPVYIRDSKTLDGAKKTKPHRVNGSNLSLKYYFVLYAYSHGGRKFKSCGKAIRKSQ